MENHQTNSSFPWRELALFLAVMLGLALFWLIELEDQQRQQVRLTQRWERNMARCLTGGQLFFELEDGELWMVEIKSQGTGI